MGADLEKGFEILDTTGKGAMTMQDIRKIFNEISPTKYTAEEVDIILNKIQADADGFVDTQLFTIAVLKGYAHPNSSSDELSDDSDEDARDPHEFETASASVSHGRSAIKSLVRTGSQ